jgi:hypothetical protein
MTTYIDFTPSTTSNFQFQATFDGNVYTVTVTWNLFGARYYVNIYDLNNALIVCRPLTGSPSGYLLSSITNDNGTATGTTSLPTTYPIGSRQNLTISGVTPNGYNGTYPCLILSPTQFSYAVDSTLTDATSFGSVAYNISLTGGYFATQLVWRVQNNQFEII